MKAGALALAGALLMSACAAPLGGRDLVEAGRTELAAAPAVASLKSLPYVGAGFEKPTDLNLRSGAVALLGADGSRRWAAGVRLPAFAGPYSITVSSRRFGPTGAGAVLYPEVVFLDEQYQEVRRLDQRHWRAAPYAMSVEAFVNDDSRGERYLVVLDARPDASMERLENANQTHTTPLLVGPVIIPSVAVGGTSVTSVMRAAPTGEVSLSLKAYRPGRIGSPS